MIGNVAEHPVNSWETSCENAGNSPAARTAGPDPVAGPTSVHIGLECSSGARPARVSGVGAGGFGAPEVVSVAKVVRDV